MLSRPVWTESVWSGGLEPSGRDRALSRPIPIRPNAYTAKIDPLIHLGIARIQKVEGLAAFAIAYEKALRTENILSGFRGTGIYPFVPTKVLNRVALPSPSTPIRPSTPLILTNLFNDAVLTSSPINFNDVQKANTALNGIIVSGNPIPTPAKQYVTFLIKNVERLHIRKQKPQLSVSFRN